MEQAPPLVADRMCGECIVCCEIPQIDDPRLSKPPGALCQHCTGSNCAIYTARPAPCREFFCHWRIDAGLNDSWRPDRSGVMITAREIGSENGPAIATVMVVFGDHAVIFKQGFVNFVGQYVGRGQEVILHIPSGLGKLAHEVPLGDLLRPAWLAGDQAKCLEDIRMAYEAIMAMKQR